MSLQRAQISIVRSIRHVSLVRDWARSRHADQPLPHFSAFQPDERSGDAADMMVIELQRTNGLTFVCRSAGERVEKIFDRCMQGQQVRDSVEPKLVVASRPIWEACLLHGMPVYSVLSVIDRNGCPVTIEQIYLPYRMDSTEVGIVVAAFHAWSTEGRFALDGLLANLPDPLVFSLTIVDPAMSVSVADDDSRIEAV